MKKKQPKKERLPDSNTTAFSIVQRITGEPPAESAEQNQVAKGKDPLAVELGRRGGLKGGIARAAALTAKKRSEIARKAAQARWDKVK